MKKTCWLVLVLCFAVYISQSVASAQTRNRRFDFLKYRANNVEELVDQISTDPSVARRYSKHFGMSVEELTRYFRENLKLTTLKSPLRSKVYFVSGNGSIKVRRTTFPAGARVFAASNGQAVLEWKCGNPLMTRLPAKPVPVVKIPPPPVEQPKLRVAPAPPLEIGAPPAIVPAVAVMPEPVPIPIVPTIMPAAEPVAATPVSIMPALSVAGVIAPLLIGAVAVEASSSKPQVPEPSGLITLGIAASGVTASWFRRRTRRVT